MAITLDGSNGITTDIASKESATFNRDTTDGDLIILQKDNATVGSIGTGDPSGTGNLEIESSSNNLYLTNANGSLFYRDNASTNRMFAPYTDATVNLGNDTERWKNLWLSGGVYLGGTGAANYLDDYEEGTFTAFLSCTGGNTGITYSSREAAYTKIGNIVIANVIIVLSSKGTASGEVRISGWPFTPVNTSGYSQIGTLGLNSTVSGGVFDGDFDCWGQLSPGDATFRMYSLDGDGGVSEMNTGHILNATSFRVSVTYHV